MPPLYEGPARLALHLKDDHRDGGPILLDPLSLKIPDLRVRERD